MAESSAKITIRGDAKHLINEAKRGEESVRKIGTAGKTAGEQMGQMTREIGKTLGKALLLKAAIAGVAQEANKVAAASAGASRTVGKSALDRDMLAGKLGISSAKASAFVGGQGARSRDEMQGLLAGLADADVRGGLSEQTLFRAQAAFQSGVVGQGEIIDAAKRGNIDSLLAEIPGRTAALSDESRRELAVRQEENSLSAGAQDAQARRGTGNRLAEARIEARDAANPVAAGLKGAVKSATGLVGGDAFIDAFDTALNRQTSDLVRLQRTPTLAPGSDQ